MGDFLIFFMISRYLKAFEGLPSLFRYTLLVAVGFGGFVVWDQLHWWSRREDYSFGYLVPLFVAVVIWDRWDRLTSLLIKKENGENEKLSFGFITNGWASDLAKWVVPIGFYSALVFGIVIFSLGAVYRASAGPSYPGSLFIALGAAFVVFSLVYINLPDTLVAWKKQLGVELPEGDAMNRRLTATMIFLFPCFVWIISAPLVSFIENDISFFLREKVAVVVLFVFEIGGYAIEREGNTLVLPMITEGIRNVVGVEDACSGIRSLMACLFAGSFLGAIFFNSVVKKILLVVFAMIFAFMTNLLRGAFLTGWAYNYGAESISGPVHDIAGYSVLALTSLMLLMLVPILNIEFSFRYGDRTGNKG